MKVLTDLWNAILANPGRTLGVVGAVILAILQTLVGKGVLTPDFQTNVENIGAILMVLITAFFPTWAPVKALAARHK